ncbi:MAG: ABC transporter substrate-binding protein [Chloroflexota bacterium]
MDLVRSPWAILPVCLVTGAMVLSGCGSTPAAKKSGSHSQEASSNFNLVTKNVLTVCSDISYPPMEFYPPNNPGAAEGADVDLAAALAKEMNLKSSTMKETAFGSIIPALQAGRCDIIMSSMNDTPLRAKKVAFVDYMTASEGILVNKGSSIHANNYSALCGKSVAVENGTTELAGLDQANKSCSTKIDIHGYPADTDAFQAFAAGHTQAYTTDLPVVSNYLKKYPSKYQKAGTAISAGQNYGIAVSKSNSTLKKALTSALHKLMSNGQYKKILDKWGVGDASLKS